MRLPLYTREVLSRRDDAMARTTQRENGPALLEKEMEYFYSLYRELPRGGPGDNASTARAYGAMRGLPIRPRILDIGCGPGMQTLELARLSNGTLTALDNYEPFLDRLNAAAIEEGLDRSIRTVNGSMFDLDRLFAPASFDIVWAEGSLSIMGFERGLERGRELLVPGGYVGVTEAVWLRPKSDAPEEVVANWADEYPSMTDIATNTARIQTLGYELIDSFVLPQRAWLANFYDPMARRVARLRERDGDEKDAAAERVFCAAEREIEIYRRYHRYFGYCFFVLQKPSSRCR